MSTISAKHHTPVDLHWVEGIQQFLHKHEVINIHKAQQPSPSKKFMTVSTLFCQLNFAEHAHSVAIFFTQHGETLDVVFQ